MATLLPRTADFTSTFEKLKVSLGLQEEKKKQTDLEELQESLSCSALTYEERMWGFALCFGAGVLLSLSSMLSFARLLRGYPSDFAIKYTLGNFLAIGSTSFLIGPRQQLANMGAERRWQTAAIWVGAMVLTLVSAFGIREASVTLFFIALQFCAGVWYCLSYIPFGQQAFVGAVKSVFCPSTPST